MKLKYRGIAYNYNATQLSTLNAIATETVGTYRGVPFRSQSFQVVQPQNRGVTLSFLGARYINFLNACYLIS